VGRSLELHDCAFVVHARQTLREASKLGSFDTRRTRVARRRRNRLRVRKSRIE